MGNAEILPLLEEISNGNQQSFKTLYLEYSRVVFAFAYNRIQDTDKAEEVVVDTLYEVWKKPTSFRGESSFKSWLLGIARNKVMSMWRKTKADHEEIDDQIPSEEPDAFELVANVEQSEGVRKCMNKLPEDQHDCLHLVFYQGCTVTEIAEIQDCPAGTVKTRLYHARQKIKNCLRLLMEAIQS